MGVEREVERRETDEKKGKREGWWWWWGGSETMEGRCRRGEMSDGGRENKKRCIGIR